MGHPKAFELAARLAALLPGDLDHAFFSNSGSEAVDTALKIALAYHRASGQGTRTRFIGRERGYHGVGFGGISVGGMVNEPQVLRRAAARRRSPAAHARPARRTPSRRGQPEHGARIWPTSSSGIVALHDASNIAAVIVEPVAGSTGVLPPPKGYLERLREICDKHGILLIFDEVITGFGRLGTAFAAEKFGVMPDLMTVAKGITNATVPMGGVFVRKAHLRRPVMKAARRTPSSCSTATPTRPIRWPAPRRSATLDIYKEEGLFERAAELAPLLGGGACIRCGPAATSSTSAISA